MRNFSIFVTSIEGPYGVDPVSIRDGSGIDPKKRWVQSGVDLDRSGIDFGGIRRRLQGQSGADFGADLVSTQNPLLKPSLSSKRLGPESQLALPLAIVISCSGSLGGLSGGGTMGAPAQRRDWPATRGFAGLGWFASSAG